MNSLTYAEQALFMLPKEVANGKVLVAGNRSGAFPLELLSRGLDVKIHVFDIHHFKAVRDRMNAAGASPVERLFCTPYVPEGPYDAAFFQTTPRSMSAELVLDQLEDIHENLKDGGVLYASFEGDRDDALATVKKVFAKAGPVELKPKEALTKYELRGFERFKRHVTVFRCVRKGPLEKRRNFSALWDASVPGDETLKFESLPGCFCHRRVDAGGLALAEIACREIKGGMKVVDMGAGCGLVGLLAAMHAKADGGVGLTLIDSHARAVEASRRNASRFGLDGVDFVLSDDGLNRKVVGEYDLFLGNPPYYSEYKIAETFISTAWRILKKGGVCLSVVKTATGLKALQEKYFGKVDVIARRGYAVLRSVR